MNPEVQQAVDEASGYVSRWDECTDCVSGPEIAAKLLGLLRDEHEARKQAERERDEALAKAQRWKDCFGHLTGDPDFQ